MTGTPRSVDVEAIRDADLEALCDVKQGSGAIWQLSENLDTAIHLCREARDALEARDAEIRTVKHAAAQLHGALYSVDVGPDVAEAREALGQILRYSGPHPTESCWTCGLIARDHEQAEHPFVPAPARGWQHRAASAEAELKAERAAHARDVRQIRLLVEQAHRVSKFWASWTERHSVDMHGVIEILEEEAVKVESIINPQPEALGDGGG